MQVEVVERPHYDAPFEGESGLDQSDLDPLVGLLNRLHFMQSDEPWTRRTTPEEQRKSLLALVDEMKPIPEFRQDRANTFGTIVAHRAYNNAIQELQRMLSDGSTYDPSRVWRVVNTVHTLYRRGPMRYRPDWLDE